MDNDAARPFLPETGVELNMIFLRRVSGQSIRHES